MGRGRLSLTAPPSPLTPIEQATFVIPTAGARHPDGRRLVEQAIQAAEGCGLPLVEILLVVGDEFDGVVAAVTSFGLFVELQGLYIEGLVHISALPADYYHFDAARLRLTGERSGRSFNLGETVRVQVARVDLDDKKVDLEMVEAPAPRKQARAGKAGKGTGKPGKKGKAGKQGKQGKAGKQGKQRRTGLRRHH